MTLKLTARQAEALYSVFEHIVNLEPVPDLAESLVKDLMGQIFKKLGNKLQSRFKGNGYSITLTDIEAKAYYLFFNQRPLGDNWRYEQSFINEQIDLLNKLYA